MPRRARRDIVSKFAKLVLGSALVLLASAVWAGVPKGKEELKIDLIEGDKGVVAFPHAKHNTDYKKAGGAAIVCKDCHHTSTDEKEVKACSGCHVKEGEAQKEHDGKKAPFLATKKGDKIDRKTVIFHARCLDNCHKAVQKESGKKITGCKTCHK